MTVLLEGGCRVADMREGAPQVAGELISLRVIEIAPRESMEFRSEDRDEVLFSLGDCTLVSEGLEQRVESQSGVFITAQKTFRFENRGTQLVFFVGVQCPATHNDVPQAVVRLADQRAMPTADRWYRVLIDSEVTQF